MLIVAPSRPRSLATCKGRQESENQGSYNQWSRLTCRGHAGKTSETNDLITKGLATNAGGKPGREKKTKDLITKGLATNAGARADGANQ